MLKPHLCKLCGVTAPELFYKSSKSKCKKCTTAAQLSYVAANPEYKARNKQAAADWQDENMLQYRLLSARARAKKKGLECSITLEHLEQLWEDCSGNCYYTGLPMALEKQDRLNSVSLDRRDNTVGYTVDNVVLCRSIMNLTKSDSTEQELADLVLALLPWAEKIRAGV